MAIVTIEVGDERRERKVEAMTLAEELATKHLENHYKIRTVGGLPAVSWDAAVDAVNEALERAAQEAESVGMFDAKSAGSIHGKVYEIAAAIRRLKSE